MTASREGIQMQARMFYCAILVVILSVFSRKTPAVKRWHMVALLCSLIAFMYLLDVHLEDQLIRNRATDSILGQALDSLTNVSSIDRDWYSIDGKKLSAEVAKPSQWPERWWRKLDLASQPSLPQIIYYFIPGFGVYLFASRSRRRGYTWADHVEQRGA